MRAGGKRQSCGLRFSKEDTCRGQIRGRSERGEAEVNIESRLELSSGSRLCNQVYRSLVRHVYIAGLQKGGSGSCLAVGFQS